MRVEGLGTTPRSEGRPDDTLLYGGLFAVAVCAFCLSQIIGSRLGLVSELVAIAGNATCGWSWLLVRALFQPARPRREMWPLGLVLILIVSGIVLHWSGASAGPLPRMVGNLGELLSSTLLLLAAIEPLRGLNPRLGRGEQIFRLTFSAGYLASLALAVIWVGGAPAGELTAQEGMAVRTACAVYSLLGMGAAIWYRHRHPLSAPRPERQRDRTSDASGLAPALRQLMVQDGLYTRQSLKVADVARRLGEPDYKITACITGPLGFRNFNQMANHFRIAEAKRQLADPAYAHLPILTIAYDCGFGSIGPFNRAFKLETGLTPQQFRKASSVPSEGFPQGGVP